MNEYTKGKMIAETKQSDLGKVNPRCSIGIEGDKILFHTTLCNPVANAKELVHRWNEYPTLKQQRDDLLEACKESQKAIMLLYECNKDVEIALGSGIQLKKAEKLLEVAIAKCEA